MNEKAVELIVVGAGISGLGFAHLAHRQGIKTLLLEASSVPGGCIRSHRFETPDGPYWAELGAHTCYNSYGNLLQMLEDTGQLELLQPKQKLPYKIQTRQGLKSIPSQLNLFELLGLVPRLLMSKKEGRTAGEYFGGILGKRNFQRVLGPALDAVVCQPAGDFPADALFRKKPRRKEVMRSYTGLLGVQSLVEGIVAQPGLELMTGTRVETIGRSGNGYRLTVADGRSFEASKLALAVAPDIAASLLQQVAPQIAELIDQVEMAEVESLAVLLRKEAIGLPPLAGIIGRDDDFYSLVSRDPVPDAGYRAFTFHFRPGRLDAAGKLARISQVLGVAAPDIQASAECYNRLPALRLGHAERIARLDQLLACESLALTGNWFSGVSIEDSLIRTADEFFRLFPSA